MSIIDFYIIQNNIDKKFLKVIYLNRYNDKISLLFVINKDNYNEYFLSFDITDLNTYAYLTDIIDYLLENKLIINKLDQSNDDLSKSIKYNRFYLTGQLLLDMTNLI